MPQPAADRNLLFGILAVQMDFITREQLFNAMQAWVFDKSKSLSDILRAQNALDDENKSLLDQLVKKHLAKHDNNTEKSLAAIVTPGNLRRDLEQIADFDVQTSLGHIGGTPQGQDPFATVMPTPSQAEAARGNVRFRIVRPHARGGLGEVFVARDQELNREVALKEIQDRAADNQESRARFLLEAEITGGLEHPGIVPVYGLGTYPDGRPYYAMRFIRGDSLKDAIERFHKNESKMSAGERALELRGLLGRFIDVCNAIAYAHSRGVLHRDLKPGNIMLGKYGETLVVDWGLAKPLGHVPESKMPSITDPGEGSLMPSSMSAASATLVGSAIGTPQYMSPEQAFGRLDQLGPATDVYSLGATLYCILTGASPVGGNDVGDMLRRVQRGDFQKPSQVVRGVPPALEAVCLKAMSLKPEDRYPTPRELADDLEHWLADEPVAAYPEPWTVRTRRWINRNMTLVTGVASAVVVALVGLIVATILLTAANERERQAKLKADENFQLAKQAVDDYHTNISEDVLLQEPGMQPLRKKLLASANEYYTKFVADRGGDPTLRGESGRALYRLAQITADIGSSPEAIKKHKEAVAIFESLQGEKSKADFQADLAASYHHLGRLYRTTEQLKESDEHYEKALKIWQPLADANPKELRNQAGLARTLMGIGNAHQNASRPAEARAAYEKSLKAWDGLANAGPPAPEYQREIGVNHSNLAMLYQDQPGKELDAEKLLRAAWTIQKKLVDDAPNVSKYQDDFAATSYLLAKTLWASHDTRAESRGLYQEAAERWQKLVDLHPVVVNFQKRLADAYLDLASAQRADQDWTQAEATCRKAVEVQRKLTGKHKDDDTYQGNLAAGLSTLAEICGANTREDRSKEAEAAFAEAIEIQQSRVGNQPTPYRVRDIARTLNRAGVYQMTRGREEKATDTFKQAVKHWEGLTKTNAASQEFAVGLSETYFHLGNMARAAGKPVDAEPWFTKAVECFDIKNANVLASAHVKTTLSNALWMRADARTKQKNFEEALKDWDRALEYAQSDMKTTIRLPRAAALARAGKHAEAAKEADAMIGKAKAGESLFRFARVYALSATAAKDQKDLADSYAQQAMKTLAAAVEAGYFKSGINQAKLHDDPDLQVLRERPEFKKLLSDYKIQ